jgi:phenylacetate-coenzyme A ligase PaaK-like adenylate-forming protein
VSNRWNAEAETLPREQLDALHLRKIQALVRHAYAHSAFYRRRFDEAGLHPATLSVPDYLAYLRRDSETWARVVRGGNIKVDGD